LLAVINTHLSTEFEVATVAILVAEIPHSSHSTKAPYTTITKATISVAVSRWISAFQGPEAMQLGGWVTVGIVVTGTAIIGTCRVVACLPSTAGGERQG